MTKGRTLRTPQMPTRISARLAGVVTGEDGVKNESLGEGENDVQVQGSQLIDPLVVAPRDDTSLGHSVGKLRRR